MLEFQILSGREVPEGWGGNGKGSVPQGAVLGLNDGGEEIDVSRAEAVSWGVAMEEISKV